MKCSTLNDTSRGQITRAALWLFASAVAMALPLGIQAKGNNVEYSPTSRNLEGNAPYSQTYSVTITSPDNALMPFPVTVTPVITPTSVPVGDAATARSYVTVTPSQLTFTAKSQTQTFTITFAMPDLGLPADSLPVTFSYQLTTTGWPSGFGVSEFGHSINARVTPPAPSGTPPTVTISSPADLSVFNYTAGQVPTTIPLQFQAAGSSTAPITAVDATLNGAPLSLSVTGIGTASAAATAQMPITAAGSYTVIARGFNQSGSAMATTRFTVNVSGSPSSPTPSLVIEDPDSGQVFNHTVGTPAVNIPFTFFASTNAGFTISAVTASLDNVSVAIGLTTGLGTGATTSTGVLQAVPAGAHQLTVTAISGGVLVTKSVTFSVVDIPAPVPPTVAINTPAAGASYPFSGSPVSIPLSFTGTSNLTNGIISGMTATLNGAPVAVTFPSGQKSPTATANLVVGATGTYTLRMTATDSAGTTEATRTFTVTPPTERTVRGTVYFDVNYSGARNLDEPPLPGITVKLYNSTGRTLLATKTTGADGSYAFTVAPGRYVVDVDGPRGLLPTICSDLDVNATSANVDVTPIGYGLNFLAIRFMSANGMSHGFWKNNLSKALANKSTGTQISAATLRSHTNTIKGLGLPLFSGLTMDSAEDILSGRSQLELQLLAAEYNYANGAYIGGSQIVTWCFIYWGEAVATYTGRYSAAYREFAKDCFDAYNNTHGGMMGGSFSFNDCR